MPAGSKKIANFLKVGLLLFPVTGLVSCGTVSSLPGLKRKTDSSTAAAAGQFVTPERQGWALMYPELTGSPSSTSTASAAATDTTSAPPPPIDLQGGTPTSAQGGLFDFSNVIQTGNMNPGGLDWHQSATDAIEASKRSGKPLMVVFVHRSNQASQSMENTFFRAPVFKTLAQKEFELLRLDFSDPETRNSSYYRDFRKRLKASGLPNIVITLPDGEVVVRLSGYKFEEAESRMDQLQAGAETAKKRIAERRKRLESEGYREWTNKDGKLIFAKLISLDANKAEFMGEWDIPFKSFTNRFSEADQAWVESKIQAAAAANR